MTNDRRLMTNNRRGKQTSGYGRLLIIGSGAILGGSVN